MTAKELKIKTLSLIEEYYPEEKKLADDNDVINKLNGVINSVLLDLVKYRKINAYKDIEITENDSKVIEIKMLIKDLYQSKKIDTDVEYEMPSEDIIVLPKDFVGKIRIYYYKYPKLLELTFPAEEDYVKQDETFKFDLDIDLLEIAPYGIAADLLKMDMISNNGRYFYERYNELKQNIDPRRTSGMITITGGVDI